MVYKLRLFYILLVFTITAWESNCNAINRHHDTSLKRDFRHISSQHQQPLLINWEYGLREAANQALIREQFTDPNLRHHLQTAPFYGKEDRATPFGDVAILARGQLYITTNGYVFVQDPYQNDCDGCHNQRSKCGTTNSCEVWKPDNTKHLVALWTVKRLRHRDGGEYRYELEYTISPINEAIRAGFVTRNQRFDYNVPGHVFVIKSDQNEKHSFEYEVPDKTDAISGEIYPTPPHRFQIGGGIRPGLLIGVTPDGQRYILQSYPTKPKGSTPNSDEIELYKNLVQTLGSKTTKTPHRFSPRPQHYQPTAFIDLGNGQLVPVINSPTPPTYDKTVYPVYPHKKKPKPGVTPSDLDILYGKLPPTESTRPTVAATEQKPLTTLHFYMPEVQEIVTNKTTIATSTKPTTKRSEKPKTTTTMSTTTTTTTKPTTKLTTTQEITSTTTKLTTSLKPTTTTTRSTTRATQKRTTTTIRLRPTQKPTTLASEEDLNFDDLFPEAPSTASTLTTTTSKATTMQKPTQPESFLESYEESAETTKQEFIRPPTTAKRTTTTKATKPSTTTTSTTTTTTTTTTTPPPTTKEPTTVTTTFKPTTTMVTETEPFLGTLDTSDTDEEGFSGIPTKPMRPITQQPPTTHQMETTRTETTEETTNTVKRTTPPFTSTTLPTTNGETQQTQFTSTTNDFSTFGTGSTTDILTTIYSTSNPTTKFEELPTAAELLPTTVDGIETTPQTTPQYIVTHINSDGTVIQTSTPLYLTTKPTIATSTKRPKRPSQDIDVDDIFGAPIPHSTKKPVIYVTQIRPEKTDDVFDGKRRGKSSRFKPTILRRRVVKKVEEPKVIFSNFFQPSSVLPPTTQLTPTMQSYSTSISIEVNNNKKLKVPQKLFFDDNVHYEPMVKAKLSEIHHPNGNIQIYKAELPESTEKSTDQKKAFDHLALQLVNHAKSIDLLTNKPVIKKNKYKRRNYTRRSTTAKPKTARRTKKKKENQ